MKIKKSSIETEVTLDSLESKRSTAYLESLGFLHGHSNEELWVLAVNEAWSKTTFTMNPHIRMYISLVLNRYHAQYLDFITTLRHFYRYCDDINNGYVQLGEKVDMRKMADVSLLYVSLFKEREKSRRELRSFSFMSACSADLYWTLGSSEHNVLGEAFREVAMHYPEASTIIRLIREPTRNVLSEVSDEVMEVASEIMLLETKALPQSSVH